MIYTCLFRLLVRTFTVYALTTTSAGAQERLPDAVVDTTRAGVVQIIATSDTLPRRSATGFRWGTPDVIVTAYHVVAGADRIVIQSTAHGIEASTATVEAADIGADLALLRTERALPGAPLNHVATTPKPGTRLWVVGYPLEVTGLRSRQLVASDIAPGSLEEALDATARADLEALGFPALDQSVLQLEGDLLPGDSGAPIIDVAGNVVAVGNGGLKRGEVGLGWGIPAARLDALLQRGSPPAQVVSLATLQKIETSFFARVPDKSVDETLWQTALQLNTLDAYQDYVTRFPAGIFFDRAQSQIEDMERRYGRAIDYYNLAMDYRGRASRFVDSEVAGKNRDLVNYNLERAIDLIPTFYDAHLQLGINKYLTATLDENNKPPFYDAIDSLNDAIDLNPEGAEPYLFRGFAYSSVSEYSYACADYIRFQRLGRTLSPEKFDDYRQELRFSRGFLEYHGCDIPNDLDFIEGVDIIGTGDDADVQRDCRPDWWVGEDVYCAERGDIESMVRVASRIEIFSSSVAFLSPEDTEEFELAVKYAASLNDNGFAAGAYYLAVMYWNGIGKPYVPGLAFELMQEAMEDGYPEAFGKMGLAVREGFMGVPNPEEARRIWTRGAVLQDSYSVGSLDDFDLGASLFMQRQEMFDDFATLLFLPTCNGYQFKAANEMARRYEDACLNQGPQSLRDYAIEGLAEIRSHAEDAIALLVRAYPQMGQYEQERIVYAMGRLRELTPEAAALLSNIAISEKPTEDPDRINLDEPSRRRNAALEALSASGPRARSVVQNVSPLLKSSDRQTRLLALGVVGESDDPTLLYLIEPLTSDSSPMVRIEAARYMDRLKAVKQ